MYTQLKVDILFHCLTEVFQAATCISSNCIALRQIF